MTRNPSRLALPRPRNEGSRSLQATSTIRKLERASRGVDTVFAMSTPFEAVTKRKHARAQHRFARRATVGVKQSRLHVGGWRRSSDRDSTISTASSRSRKRYDGPECRSRSSRRSSSWRTFSRVDGARHRNRVDRAALPRASPAQIRCRIIAQFTALVIERRESFLGKRIDIASDSLTLANRRPRHHEVSGRHIKYTALPIRPHCVSSTKIKRACSSGSTRWIRRGRRRSSVALS